METLPQAGELSAQLDRLEQKIDAMSKCVDRLKLYFQLMLWVSVGVVLLPLLGLLFIIPTFLRTLTSVTGLY